MKPALTFVILAFSFFHSTNLTAQITIFQEDFESWEPVSAFEEPYYWETNNLDTAISVSPTFDAWNGDLAARITGELPYGYLTQPGYLGIHLSPNEVLPNQLRVMLKQTDITDTSYAAIYHGIFYDGGNYHSQLLWLNYDEISDWEELIFPLDFSVSDNIQSYVIKFFAGPVKTVNPSYTGNGSLYVDRLILEIDDLSTTSSEVTETEKTIISPNPARGFIRLQTEGPLPEQYSITDLSGKLMSNQLINDPEIRLPELPNGLYLLHLSYADRQEVHQLLILK